MHISENQVEGSLEDTTVSELLDECHKALLTGTVKIESGDVEAELELRAGAVDAVDFRGMEKLEAIAELRDLKSGSFILTQRLPSLSGELAESARLEGKDSDVSVIELMQHCEENALSCTIVAIGERDRAEIHYRIGEIEDVIVNGESDVDKIVEVIRLENVRFQLTPPPLELGIITWPVVRKDPTPPFTPLEGVRGDARGEAVSEGDKAEAKAETEKPAAEKAEAKAEKERAEAEKAEREKAEREKAEREKAEREKAEAEKAEREKAEREKAEREKAEAEKAEREKAEREKAEREKAEAEKAEREKAEREKAEAEKAEREKAEKEKGDETSESDKAQAEKEKARRKKRGKRRKKNRRKRTETGSGDQRPSDTRPPETAKPENVAAKSASDDVEEAKAKPEEAKPEKAKPEEAKPEPEKAKAKPEKAKAKPEKARPEKVAAKGEAPARKRDDATERVKRADKAASGGVPVMWFAIGAVVLAIAGYLIYSAMN